MRLAGSETWMEGRPGAGALASARARRAPRGVTLVETMMVLVVVGIGVGAAIPHAPIGPLRLDASARGVFKVLEVAQYTALARQHDVIVSFDVAGGTIRVLEDRNDDGQVSVGEHLRWLPLEDNVSFGTPPAGISGAVAGAVVGSKVETIDSMPSVIFHRNGSASTDLEVYLTANSGRTVMYRAISVVQATARATWYRWSGTAWKEAGL